MRETGGVIRVKAGLVRRSPLGAVNDGGLDHRRHELAVDETQDVDVGHLTDAEVALVLAIGTDGDLGLIGTGRIPARLDLGARAAIVECDLDDGGVVDDNLRQDARDVVELLEEVLPLARVGTDARDLGLDVAMMHAGRIVGIDLEKNANFHEGLL